jgi:hypothetical protein
MLGKASTEEHKLVLEGSRKLRGRWRTVVRRVIRENKSLEVWQQKKPPSFEQFLWHRDLDDTYSNRFEKSIRQDWVDRYMERVRALYDTLAFRVALGSQLSKFTDENEVIVEDAISHSDTRLHQPTLWFTTEHTPKR